MVASGRSGAAVRLLLAVCTSRHHHGRNGHQSPPFAFRPVCVIASPSSCLEAGSARENWHQAKSGVKCRHSGFTPRRDGAPREVAGRGRGGARSAGPDRPRRAAPHRPPVHGRRTGRSQPAGGVVHLHSKLQRARGAQRQILEDPKIQPPLRGPCIRSSQILPALRRRPSVHRSVTRPTSINFVRMVGACALSKLSR